MNQNEIENLKSVLSKLAGTGCKLKNTAYGVDGRIIGIGFRPLWSNQYDTKIDKLEFNVIDNSGRIIPFYIYNIIGFDVVEKDGRSFDSSKNISLDIHVFSPQKSREKEPYDKVRLDIISL